MRKKYLIITIVIFVISLLCSYKFGFKIGKQKTQDLLDSELENKDQNVDKNGGYAVISEAAKSGSLFFSAISWFKAETVPKHNIVAFGTISFPNSNFDDYEEHERKPYIIYGYIIDADGKVYYGDYSDGEKYEDIYYSLLSEDSIECVGNIDENMLTRLNKAVSSDEYYDTEWISLSADGTMDKTWSCDLYLVRHMVNNRFECINMYNDYDVSNGNNVLMDLGRDVLKYLRELYCDKYNETSDFELTPDFQ